MQDIKRYGQRGVSASKSEVHEAIQDMSKGLYPRAFCKIMPDLIGGHPDYCNIMHADTAGTKTSLAYIYWRETGDLSVWAGIVQDAIVMNIDDMACTGCVDNIIISSTIGRNKNLIPAEVLKEVIQGSQRFIDQMAEHGVQLTLAGGETADVGDIVRTIDVGITAFGRMLRSQAITNDIQPGDVIVGLSSSGQAAYESHYNGGMGSNGLTSARHDLFSKRYAEQYPESFDPHIDDDLVYCGSMLLTDPVQITDHVDVDMGRLVLSPTRTYLPILKHMLEQCPSGIHGLIHCTGGAQTKILKFVDGLKVIKDNLLPIPPLFELIEQQSGTNRKEMYEVFNMGHRVEIYCSAEVADDLIQISNEYNVDAQVIGRVEKGSKNELMIKDASGIYIY